MSPNPDSQREPSREELIALIAAQAAGKPPRPARTQSLRGPSNKPSGGQKGHKGETLEQVAAPDHVIDHVPPSCATCGSAMTLEMTVGHSARQVFDLPAPAPLIVTEHRAHDCRCAACGARRSCAARLQEFVAIVRDRVAAAAVKHMDETGFRVGGKTQWLHIGSTALLTFYRICHKRGSLLANVVGTVVHDHWKPYYTLPGVRHALCNAHHLRELKALIEIEKEDWARRMQQLLRRACHAANLARERGGALATLKPRLAEQLQRRYDAIVAEGLAYHEAQGALAAPLAHATSKDAGPPRGRLKRRIGH